jgi:hypothetical protein
MGPRRPPWGQASNNNGVINNSGAGWPRSRRRRASSIHASTHSHLHVPWLSHHPIAHPITPLAGSLCLLGRCRQHRRLVAVRLRRPRHGLCPRPRLRQHGQPPGEDALSCVGEGEPAITQHGDDRGLRRVAQPHARRQLLLDRQPPVAANGSSGALHVSEPAQLRPGRADDECAGRFCAGALTVRLSAHRPHSYVPSAWPWPVPVPNASGLCLRLANSPSRTT